MIRSRLIAHHRIVSTLFAFASVSCSAAPPVTSGTVPYPADGADWVIGVGFGCEIDGPARDITITCVEEFTFHGDGHFRCPEGAGRLPENEGRPLLLGLLRLFARVSQGPNAAPSEELVLLRYVENARLLDAALSDADVRDVRALLAPLRERCVHAEGREPEHRSRAYTYEDPDAYERDANDVDPRTGFDVACPQQEDAPPAAPVPSEALAVLALEDAAASRAIAADPEALIAALTDIAALGLHAQSARARDLVVAHYRRGLRRHPWVAAHRALVTREWKLAGTATPQAISRVIEAGDASLAPLLYDALERDDLETSVVGAMLDYENPAPEQLGRLFVPNYIALLAAEDTGNTASMVLGRMATDPDAIYLDAIARDAMSVSALGWMWGGFERSTAASRRALLDYIMTTMLDDMREIPEIDGRTDRTRTVADAGLSIVSYELGDLDFVGFETNEALREAIVAVRRWWRGCP